MGGLIDGLGLGAKIGSYIWACVGAVILYRQLTGHQQGVSREVHADQMQLLAARMELVIKDTIREMLPERRSVRR